MTLETRPTDKTHEQTKHAAELCALLVNDLHGELPSVRKLLQPYIMDISEIAGLT
jgi:hypothetical protein